MPAFLASVRDLILFRRGPEDVPYSWPLLIGLLVGCGALQAWFNWHDGAKLALVAGALAGSLAEVCLVFAMLRGRGTRERFVQATTALAITYLLFGLAKNLLMLRIPVKAWRAQLVSHPGHLPAMTGQQTTVVFAVAILGVWQLCVWVSILRRSLEVSAAGGVLALIGLFFASVVVTVLVAGLLGAA